MIVDENSASERCNQIQLPMTAIHFDEGYSLYNFSVIIKKPSINFVSIELTLNFSFYCNLLVCDVCAK